MAATRQPEIVLSHWSTLIEGFQTSPLGFFEAVEAALRRREVPDTKIGRVDYSEGGALSANREYLQVTREKLVFDISAAPFGTGFFVSWWLAENRRRLDPASQALILLGMLLVTGFIFIQFGLVIGFILLVVLLGLATGVLNQMVDAGTLDEGIVRSVPLIGALYVRLVRPPTYYRIDKMEMFQTAMHNAVIEVIDGMTTEKGLRALSDSDRRPVMKDFYKS